MARVKTTKSSGDSRKVRPALTPEARESQLISLATDLAEQQLRDGTASSQVITHYLKLGSPKERLDRAAKEEEIKLLKAKTEAIKASKDNEKLYKDAIAAMRRYSGNGGDNNEDIDEESEDY